MRVYHGGGFDEFTPEEFLIYVFSNNLKIEIGTIQSFRILERKPFSNKGNALDGRVKCEKEEYISIGLNIGGNPIGTGYKNYIPFLKEMRCRKKGHLYVLDSLVGADILYLLCEDTLRGYLTPRGFLETKKIDFTPE